MLRRHELRQNNEKLLAGQAYNDNGFIFTWPDGRILEPNYFSKHFLKTMRENEFGAIHFHALRHSFASMLLKAGVHPKVVQELLGDASLSVVNDNYAITSLYGCSKFAFRS